MSSYTEGSEKEMGLTNEPVKHTPTLPTEEGYYLVKYKGKWKPMYWDGAGFIRLQTPLHVNPSTINEVSFVDLVTAVNSYEQQQKRIAELESRLKEAEKEKCDFAEWVVKKGIQFDTRMDRWGIFKGDDINTQWITTSDLLELYKQSLTAA